MNTTIKKWLKSIAIVLIVLATLLGLLQIFNFQPISLDVKIIKTFYLLPWLMICLVVLLLIVRVAMVSNTLVTKWICLIIGSLNLIVYLVVNVILSFEPVNWVIFPLGILMLIVFILLPLLIKNHQWTKWLLIFYLLPYGFLWGAATYQKYTTLQRGGYHELLYVKYQNTDHSPRQVALFRNKGLSIDSIPCEIRRYPLVMQRLPFAVNQMNGIWCVKDANGHLLSQCTYNNGKRMTCEPIIPPGAKVVQSTADLIVALRTLRDNDYLALMGQLSLSGSKVIQNKSGVIISSVLNADRPIVEASGIGDTYLSFINCHHIKISGLRINFRKNNLQPTLISLKNCSDVTIEYCDLTGNAQYLIDIDSQCRQINITNCNFDGYTQRAITTSQSATINLVANGYYRKGHFYPHQALLINDRDNDPEKFGSSMIKEMKQHIRSSYFREPNACLVEVNNYPIGAFSGLLNDIPWAVGLDDIFQSVLPNVSGNDIYAYPVCLIENISGLSPLIHTPTDTEHSWTQNGVPRFQHINPEFVKWAAGFITNGCISHDFYNGALQDYARQMCRAYYYLHRVEDKASIVETYKRHALNANAFSYLKERYGNLWEKGTVSDQESNPKLYTNSSYDTELIDQSEPEYDEEDIDSETQEDGSYHSDEPEFYVQYNQQFKNAYLMGFWIRRSIDGSDKAIWDAMKKAMLLYDHQWMQDTGLDKL